MQLEVVGTDQPVAQLRHRPEEAHHEVVRGLLVQLTRRPRLLDPATRDHDDAVGHLHRLLLIVGDEDGRNVHLVVQAAQPLAELLAHLGVEGAERLVEEQHLGLDGEGARQRHALPLPTGELRR